MTLSKRGAGLATGGAVLALLVSACGGGDSSDNGNKPSAAGEKGGQIQILLAEDFEHLDPARNFVTNSGNFGRLLYRTLTNYKETSGKPLEVVGDLAKEWSSTPDFKTWTFTLKDGLKYEDGTAITTKDIKYGVERSFSADLAEGAPYARDYMDCDGYKGPYVNGNNGGKGCEAITTPDDKTIVFKLNQGVQEFPFTTSLTIFAPVPQAKDTKTEYDNHVFSSGPYKIDTYVRGQEMTLSRNPNWDQSTDPIRTALPDTWKLTMGLDPAVLDTRLLNDGANDQNALSLDTVVQNENLSKITQPTIAPRIVKGASQCVRYIALNQMHKPLDNVKVRQAIQFAINKQDFQTANGGELAGVPVDSVIPQSLKGYEDVSAYKADVTGDVAKAKALLTEAGFANGFSTELATTDTPKGVNRGLAIQNALARVGIKVTVKKIPGDNYYTTQQDDKAASPLAIAGWCPDWPSSSTVVPPVFGEDGSTPGKPTTNNYSRFKDQGVWDRMDEIGKIADPDEAATAWGDLNDKIMKDFAPIVPLVDDRVVFVRGSKVANMEISGNFGEPDVIKLGVKQ